MAWWEKSIRSMRDSAEKVSFEADRLVRVKRLEVAVAEVRTEMQARLASLGQTTLGLYRQQVLSHPSIAFAEQQIARLEAQVARYEAEMEAIRAEKWLAPDGEAVTAPPPARIVGDVACPACGSTAPATATYCPKCGHSLPRRPGERPGAPTPVDPSASWGGPAAAQTASSGPLDQAGEAPASPAAGAVSVDNDIVTPSQTALPRPLESPGLPPGSEQQNTLTCANCGRPSEAGRRFCPYCGSLM